MGLIFLDRVCLSRVHLHKPSQLLIIHPCVEVIGFQPTASNGGAEIRGGENIRDYSEAWIIIDTVTNQTGKAFVNHAAYKDALTAISVANSTPPPHGVYKNFYNSGKLKWPL